jgi:hypothetical protein
MEQDWGFYIIDARDDYVQSYEELICDSIGEQYDEDTEAYTDLKIVHAKRKRNAKTFVSQNKKKSRKNMSGTELYYEEILSWTPLLLLHNCRKKLSMQPLRKAISHFKSKYEYIDYIRQIPYEESRASLYRSLTCPESICLMKLVSDFSDIRNRGDLLILDFELVNTNMNDIRPGTVLCFIPSVVVNSAPSSTNNYKNQKSKWNLLSTLPILIESCEHTPYPAFTGTIVQAAHRNNSSKYCQCWVHEDALISYTHPPGNQSTTFNWCFTVFHLTNLISYQRQAIACFDCPSPSFFDQILGYQPPKHIKFADSYDDSDFELDSIHTQSTSKCGLCYENTIIYDAINEAQKVALHECLNIILENKKKSDFCRRGASMHMIQGPPGCGAYHPHLIFSC